MKTTCSIFSLLFWTLSNAAASILQTDGLGDIYFVAKMLFNRETGSSIVELLKLDDISPHLPLQHENRDQIRESCPHWEGTRFSLADGFPVIGERIKKKKRSYSRVHLTKRIYHTRTHQIHKEMIHKYFRPNHRYTVSLYGNIASI